MLSSGLPLWSEKAMRNVPKTKPMDTQTLNSISRPQADVGSKFFYSKLEGLQ